VAFIRVVFGKPEGTIALHEPVFAGNEKKYLEQCIDSSYVSSVGQFVDLFAERLADYCGAKDAVLCVNGTCALHLALRLLGVGPGDEVITQPLTFVATANAIAHCGAHPVFVDVDRDTLGLSPDALEVFIAQETIRSEAGRRNRKTGRRIAACIPMHTFGHPCRIDRIVDICRTHDIPVVEDAAEGMGSLYRGKHAGTFGDIGVLSFNGNKTITTGGGGALLFSDERLACRAKHLTTQAKVPHPWEFIHDEVGFNYRMPNINAALGLAQLENLNRFLQAKRQLAERYAAFFRKQGIPFVTEPPHARSNYWLNAILLDNAAERDEFLALSHQAGIMTRPAWRLMTELPMFRSCQAESLPNARWLDARLVNLPSSAIL
jgi:perosamine synthetase